MRSILAAAACTFATVASADIPITVVARLNTVAPSPLGPLAFRSFTGADLGPNGHLTLLTQVTGGPFGPAAATALSVADPNAGYALEAFAVPTADAPFPELDYGTFFYAPTVDGQGNVLFEATLDGDGVTDNNHTAMLRHRTDGTTEILLREGDPAPGFDGLTLASVSRIFPLTTQDGELAFHIGLDGPGVDSSNSLVIYAGPAEDLRPILRDGDPAPNIDAGVTIDQIIRGLGVDNNGRVLAQARLQGPGITDQNNRIYYRLDENNAEILVRTGHNAPGFDPPEPITFITRVDANTAGQTVIAGGTASTSAIWLREANGDTRLIARPGDQLPGLPDHTLRLIDDPIITASGELRLYAELDHTDTGEDIAGLWAGHPDDLQPLILTGMPALHDENATVIDILRRTHGRTGTGLNYVTLRLSDAASAVYAGHTGQLQEVLRTGTVIELEPGDERTVIQPDLPFNTHGLDLNIRSPLSDDGRLALTVSFVGGTTALITADLRCNCDTDNNGDVNVLDLLIYIDQWLTEHPDAERTGDAPPDITVADLLDHVDCWLDTNTGAPCP